MSSRNPDSQRSDAGVAALLDELAAKSLPVPSAACTERIRQRCVADLQPLPTVSLAERRMRSVILCALALVGSAAFMVWQAPSYPSTEAWLGALTFGVALIILIAFGIGKSRGALSRPQLALVFAVPASFVLYFAAFTHAVPFGTYVEDPTELEGTLRCGATCLVVGGLVTFALFKLWRMTDAFTPRITGALAGIGGALLAALSVGLGCPCVTSWHFWLGHALSVCVLASVGALAGEEWLTP